MRVLLVALAVGLLLVVIACDRLTTQDVLDQKTEGKVIYATTECVTPNSDGVRCDKKTCKKDANSDCKILGEGAWTVVTSTQGPIRWVLRAAAPNQSCAIECTVFTTALCRGFGFAFMAMSERPMSALRVISGHRGRVRAMSGLAPQERTVSKVGINVCKVP